MIEITEKKNCCGCTACASICPRKCIKMKEDEEGFLYPHVLESECIHCNLCENVCPILNHTEKSSSKQIAAIVQNKDKEVCRQSTAGGAFTAIAEYVLDRQGVVYGVEMQKDYTVRHTTVEKKDDLVKFRNSKYVQSNLENIFSSVKQQLNVGRWVCFSGTPCQVEGLRSYLKKDYKNLILVDVVCRAVPSPGVWKRYIKMETQKYGELQSIRFRDKTLGYQYSTMELKNGGGVYRGGIESQPWLRMFFSGMIIRPSCSACKFRSRYRNSDFTIWDCFNVYSFDKNFDESIGTTRVLIHTEKGKQIFEAIKEKFYYKKLEADIAVKDVREMRESPKEHIRKAEFYSDMEKLTMQELLDKYYPITFKIRIKRRARLILNSMGLDKTVKHILNKGK